MESKNNKLQAKDLINVGIFTAIYFVIFFAGMMLGYTVLQQFLRHLDDGRDLVRTKRDLTEAVITLGDLTFFIDPAGRTIRGNQRNLSITGRGVNHLAQGTELVFFLQSLYQSALILVRNEIQKIMASSY